MIVPMKHVSVLCLAQDAESALHELRQLGLLHVVMGEIQEETVSDLKDATQKAEAAYYTLEQRPVHPRKPKTDTVDGDDIVEKVHGLQQRLHDIEEEHHQCRLAIQAIKPFGQFEPAALEDLRRNGIHVKLLRAQDPHELDVPDGVLLHELSHMRQGTYLAAVAQHDFEMDGTVTHLPHESLRALQQTDARLQQDLKQVERELDEWAHHTPALKAEWDQRQEALAFARVHAALSEHGDLRSLSGFCPANKVQAMSAAAARHGWALATRDPEPGEEVPTLLHLPAWIRPIKAVLQMLSILPGYRESDISGVFLVFFSIFFAILIGDAGYGLLFLALTLLARLKLPKAPAYPFVLFGILSGCTLLWGAITGNWFGIPTGALPGPLQTLEWDLLSGPESRNTIIRLCFLIGAIHLSIAHTWNAIALAPSLKALSQLGWIGLVWSMFFTALNMVLQQPLPAFFLPLLLGSILLIVLFMTAPKDFKTEWIHHAMFPLSIVNCFVDIVSYIRLFAVGMASLSVAASFNDMAMQIGLDRIWTVPLVAIILLLGHGLNILLCALGILVHGVRLNTLEFSLHKNMEWKGFAYAPFAPITQNKQ